MSEQDSSWQGPTETESVEQQTEAGETEHDEDAEQAPAAPSAE